MKKIFKDFAVFVHLHNGHNKPKIDFQYMYRLFPDFTFQAIPQFGSYQNTGGAFENKVYDMVVSDGKNTCYMTYREYVDADENTAYVS